MTTTSTDNHQPIRRLLIANRGEPAMRAIRTCRRLGIESAVIYSREDASSEWVFAADYAFEILSRAGAADTPYMDGGQIVRIAKANSCTAIWPGWGFLSENAAFAQAVLDAGIVWVGPPPKAMELLGSKRSSMEAARQAGFEVLEQLVIPDSGMPESEAAEALARLALPLVIKPSHGGGGQGQRIIERREELVPTLGAVREQARAAWGSGELIVQRYLTDTRHIELQVLADDRGNVCALGTRDCSIQRRNQKIIEEGPVEWLPGPLLEQATASAVRLFRAAGYRSAATVEMLLADGRLYFLEVNTRLQVEHPVTEESTVIVRDGREDGLDLLAEMLRIAGGQPLSFTQEMVRSRGYAIEARLYAENPDANFAPTPGSIYYVTFPQGAGVRVDTALHGPTGKISRRFDPMFAKIIASAATREEARARLHEALCSTVVLGITTNVDFLRRITLHDHFKRGDYRTDFIARAKDSLSAHRRPFALAATISCILSYINHHRLALEELRSPHIHSIYDVLSQLPAGGIEYVVAHGDGRYRCKVREWNHGSFLVECSDGMVLMDVSKINSHIYAVRAFDGTTFKAYALLTNGAVQLVLNGEYFSFEVARAGATINPPDPHGSPYGGKLLRLYVQAGNAVIAGDPLFSIESMKMESTVRAACNGFIDDVLVREGEGVEAGEIVVRVVPFEKEQTSDAAVRALEAPFPSNSSVLQLFSEPSTTDGGGSDGANICGDLHARVLASLPERFFMAYDLGHASALRAFRGLFACRPSEAAAILERCAKFAIAIFRLADDDRADLLLDYLRGGLDVRMPAAFNENLEVALSLFGVVDIKNWNDAAGHFPRLLLALTRSTSQSTAMLLDMIDGAAADAALAPRAAAMLASMLRSGMLETDSDLKNRALNLLRNIDVTEYYAATQPPVAFPLLQEYADFVASPLSTLNGQELERMHRLIADSEASPGNHPNLPEDIRGLLASWFDEFSLRPMYASDAARASGIHLFELRPLREPSEPRMLAVGVLSSRQHLEGDRIAFTAVERTAIEAYRSIAQYEALSEAYKCNHVVLAAEPQVAFRWSRGSRDGRALSPSVIRLIASHVSGFARRTRVVSSEILVRLDLGGRVVPHIIELNYIAPTRVMSRPPYPVEERAPESHRKRISLLNEKQHRRGKLLNTDRARLLFDHGVYEELQFPDAESGDGLSGLNVYRGTVRGIPCLAYAGDFRIRGGALGEREGKKLASAVVLAYASDLPLIGIHDGAGANIEDSVVSLGWAGAYFGAIANTGGFSTPQRFWDWYERHHERPYFDAVLKSFGLDPRQCPRSASRSPTSRFLHLHLNLGATVGMLVYGASISAMSIMVKHPEMYRVLTGAATVELVLGEKTTNYELGGVPTHAHYSGDIDIACATEEAAIMSARSFVHFVLKGRRATAPANPNPPERQSSAARESTEAFIEACDPDSFRETRATLKGANRLQTGYAAIHSQPVGLALLSSRYGIRIARGFKKLYFLFAGCQEFGLPLVTLSLDRWHRVPRRSDPRNLYLRAECDRLYANLTVPRVSIAVGPKSLDEPVHYLADILCYVPDGTENAFDSGRADALAHLRAPTIAAAAHLIGRLLPYLLNRAAPLAPEPPDAFRLRMDISEAYDMRQALPALFDEGSLLEVQASDGQPLCTAFARIGGLPLGIIADNPLVGGGAQTATALGKFTRFNRLCERFSLPLLQLNDSPAFQPGWKQECLGIQGEGGKSLREECISSIPRLAVTLRQNYGGRFIHANLKTLGPGRRAIACQGSRIGVMGADGAIAILHQRHLNALPPEERAAERERLKADYVQRYLDPGRALDLGYLDAIVPMQDLRSEIDRWRRSCTGS